MKVPNTIAAAQNASVGFMNIHVFEHPNSLTGDLSQKAIIANANPSETVPNIA